jgi:hypothetical protein
MKMGMQQTFTPEQRQEIKTLAHLSQYGPMGVYLGRWGHNVIVRIEALEKEVADLKERIGDDG